jgi:hypothetical protein
MALAGMDPPVAAERLEHSDGGALFSKTYRHLYEGEKREQAKRLQALVIAALDEKGTRTGESPPKGRDQADQRMGGTGLEPVTPSLSRRRNRSRPFARIRRNGAATRLAE